MTEVQFDALVRRIQLIERGKRNLRAAMEVFNTCENELLMQVREFRQRLDVYEQTEGENIKKLRREEEDRMAAAIKEVERTITEENPVLNSPLAAALRSGTTVEPLTYSFDIASTFPIRLTYEISETHDISPSIFPQIAGNTLTTYNFQNKQSISSILPLSFTRGADFCLIRPDSVLCVGGMPYDNSAFELTLSTGAMKATQPMKVPRGWPGVIKYGQFVYVFGGNNPSLTSSEKYSISQSCWSDLPNMLFPRYSFSPCLHHKEIYLADFSQAHKKFECFNMAREEYRLLDVELPFQLSGHSVAFVVDGEITFITYQKVAFMLKLGVESMFKIMPVELSEPINGYSNITPVKYDREVFWVRFTDGQLLRYNLDTKIVVE